MNIDPTRSEVEAFKSLRRDAPVNMLNLVRLRVRAAFSDGRGATGAEAYADYRRESAPVFQRVGGAILWRGAPECALTGRRRRPGTSRSSPATRPEAPSWRW